ncbi:WG repeat-containing protein [Actinoplanes philippinensis]|uniref:WG repeat-containing protein n=1 Tax=Actinoplanes philippinensis TaxID=35752 RepID=UPI003411B5C0
MVAEESAHAGHADEQMSSAETVTADQGAAEETETDTIGAWADEPAATGLVSDLQADAEVTVEGETDAPAIEPAQDQDASDVVEVEEEAATETVATVLTTTAVEDETAAAENEPAEAEDVSDDVITIADESGSIDEMTVPVDAVSDDGPVEDDVTVVSAAEWAGATDGAAVREDETVAISLSEPGLSPGAVESGSADDSTMDVARHSDEADDVTEVLHRFRVAEPERVDEGAGVRSDADDSVETGADDGQDSRSEEELDLTRTMQIVRLRATAAPDDGSGDEVADQGVDDTASADDEVTEISVHAADEGSLSPDNEAEIEESVEPDTAVIVSEPETAALSVEPETAALSVEPETAALSVEPETAALSVEPETVVITAEQDVEPQTIVLGTEPETVAIHPEPETVAIQTEPETVALSTPAETAADAVDAATTVEAAEPETAEAPDASAPAAEDEDAAGDDAGDAAGSAPAVPPQGVTAATESESAPETSVAAASRMAPPEAGRVEPVRQRRDQRAPADRRRADPEQILAAYPWTYDPQTLREQVDEPDRLWDVADRLTDRLEFAERDNVRAGLLSLRAVVYRIVGELDDALADGRDGLRHAEAAGELRGTAIAQARLAHVLQWRGEFEEADRLYAGADSPELPPRTRAEICELAGRSAYEQGRYLEAVNLFERALDVRRGEDPELVERIELALDAISRRSGVAGWGPYPRTRDEVLGLPEAPVPLLDDGVGLWGYAAAVEPRFVEAQPFAEGVAWVRRPESAAWELIDPRGELVIAAAHGYTGAARFAEGLAWVSRDQGGWFAIDTQNRLVVPAGGFEDARPFRRGLAVVRQGGVWGAVDRNGRFAVTPRYQRFATALHIGGAVDGFTDDGLAVVDAGDRFGVVDRAGRTVVEPVHASVVIHPVAFLVRNAAGLWGALDRTGAPMIDMGHRDVASLVGALPEESRPVL